MAAPKAESRPKRQLFVAAAGVTAVLAVVAIWAGVHRIPWLGPRLHEIGVSVLGRTVMGWVERIAYTADSGWNKLWGIDERPEAIWNTPIASASASASGTWAPAVPWSPHDPGPLVHTPFAKGDGLWFPIVEGKDGSEAVMFRLTLHPDGDRADSLVKIATLDTSRSEVRWLRGKMPGKGEGTVAPEHKPRLYAIVVAGRKAPRGGYGLAVDGTVLLRPKTTACVIGKPDGGPVRVGYWSALQAELSSSGWWRQAPPCLVEGGELQPSLEENTVPAGRRTLVGLSRDGRSLLVGVSVATADAKAARAMRHCGAWAVARLDTSDGEGDLYYYANGAADGADGKALLAENARATELATRGAEVDFMYVVHSR